MTETPDADALYAGAAHATARTLARLLAASFRLAARTDPDILRDAVADLFDLSAWVESGKNVRRAYDKAATDVRHLCREVEKLRAEVKQLADQLDAARVELELCRRTT